MAKYLHNRGSGHTPNSHVSLPFKDEVVHNIALSLAIPIVQSKEYRIISFAVTVIVGIFFLAIGGGIFGFLSINLLQEPITIETGEEMVGLLFMIGCLFPVYLSFVLLGFRYIRQAWRLHRPMSKINAIYDRLITFGKVCEGMILNISPILEDPEVFHLYGGMDVFVIHFEFSPRENTIKRNKYISFERPSLNTGEKVNVLHINGRNPIIL